MAIDIGRPKEMTPPQGMEFHIHKVSHVVLYWGVDQVINHGRVRSLEEAIANTVPGQETHLPT